ncbi:hypothetical protein BU16DRAFT_582621, partial [Lophium mytilinum]
MSALISRKPSATPFNYNYCESSSKPSRQLHCSKIEFKNAFTPCPASATSGKDSPSPSSSSSGGLFSSLERNSVVSTLAVYTGGTSPECSSPTLGRPRWEPEATLKIIHPDEKRVTCMATSTDGDSCRCEQKIGGVDLQAVNNCLSEMGKLSPLVALTSFWLGILPNYMLCTKHYSDEDEVKECLLDEWKNDIQRLIDRQEVPNEEGSTKEQPSTEDDWWTEEEDEGEAVAKEEKGAKDLPRLHKQAGTGTDELSQLSVKLIETQLLLEGLKMKELRRTEKEWEASQKLIWVTKEAEWAREIVAWETKELEWWVTKEVDYLTHREGCSQLAEKQVAVEKTRLQTSFREEQAKIDEGRREQEETRKREEEERLVEETKERNEIFRQEAENAKEAIDRLEKRNEELLKNNEELHKGNEELVKGKEKLCKENKRLVVEERRTSEKALQFAKSNEQLTMHKEPIGRQFASSQERLKRLVKGKEIWGQKIKSL